MTHDIISLSFNYITKKGEIISLSFYHITLHTDFNFGMNTRVPFEVMLAAIPHLKVSN